MKRNHFTLTAAVSTFLIGGVLLAGCTTAVEAPTVASGVVSDASVELSLGPVATEVLAANANANSTTTNNDEWTLDGQVVVDPDADYNAALFSDADLTISGDGSLTVSSSVNDGINATSGTSTTTDIGGVVVEKDDGAMVSITGGETTVDSAGDGIDSNGSMLVTSGSRCRVVPHS